MLETARSGKRIAAMNNEVSNLDHADDDILIHEISDDALESAGDPGVGRPCFSFAGGDCTTIPACFPR